MDLMIDKINSLRQLGAVEIMIGIGNVQYDSISETPILEETIRVIFSPIAYGGSMRAMYFGTIQSFLEFDFTSTPSVLTNPPSKNDYSSVGFYCFGNRLAMDKYNTTGKLFNT